MPRPEDRHRISREDAGILLSFATRPDRLTDDLIKKLGDGVTYSELVEISAWVGLPKSTAEKLVRAEAPRDGSTNVRATALSMSYRRSLVGILAAFVLGTAALNIAWDRSWWTVFSLTVVFGLTAHGLYSLIVRVASP